MAVKENYSIIILTERGIRAKNILNSDAGKGVNACKHQGIWTDWNCQKFT